MKLNRFRYLKVLILTVGIGSCEKLVEVPPPVNELVSSSVFTNDRSAISAVSGIYSTMQTAYGGFAAGGFVSFNHLSGTLSDEFNNYFENPDDVDIANNNINSRNGEVLALWSAAYNTIYQANAVIEGLTDNTAISEITRKQLMGEVLFIRAYAHFFLVNSFGSIPLVMTTDYVKNNAIGQTSRDLVYGQIVTDLKEAKSLLTESYPSVERVRINKFAAAALLARVYLYTRSWSDAEQEATEVIDQTSIYSLEKINLEDIFLSNNREAIWQLKPVFGMPNEAQFFILYSAPFGFNVALTDDFLNAFETGDKRKDAWVGVISDGQEYYYPNKYKSTWTVSRPENSVRFRLAELYLIRSEARVHLEDLPAAQADLDEIRARAGLLPTTANDKAALLLAIEQERRVELFAEDSHRWMDLVRTSRALPVLQSYKGQNFQANDTLLPIPFSEIEKNKNLKQNDGYN